MSGIATIVGIILGAVLLVSAGVVIVMHNTNTNILNEKITIPQSVSLQQWVYYKTGYLPPNPPYAPSQATTWNYTTPPNTFAAYDLVWPYAPTVATLQDWISVVKYYLGGNYSSPYNNVTNIPYTLNETHVPQNVQKIYWSALEWGFNNANLMVNGKDLAS